MRRFVFRVGMFMALVLSAGVVAPAFAQTATFTDVFNSTNTEFSGFIGYSVNSAGTVAFVAVRSATAGGGGGIYTALNTSGVTAIALDTSPEFSAFSIPTINSSGTVAFLAGRDAGGQGIYTASNISGFTTVALSTTPEFSILADPSLNSNGVVAFRAKRDPLRDGIYTATNTNASNTVALNSNSEFRFLDGSPVINSIGVVAFRADRNAAVGGGSGIYTATNTGSFTTIALTTSPEFSGFGLPTINSAGLIAFTAGRDAGGSGVYTATNAGRFNTIALSDSPEFSAFNSAVLNNLGTVAFSASRDAGGTGIYAALTGITNPFTIIRTGDTLFGSTVTDLNFYQGLAEDSNTLAFTYTLANGVTGIARANISNVTTAPEPASFALFTLSSLPVGVGVLRHRKRRHCCGKSSKKP